MIETTLGLADSRALLVGFAQGLALGLPASALFFAGLAWSLRRALASRRPAVILLLSFIVRAGILVGLGLLLVRHAEPLWAPLAYLLAFFLVRTLAVRRARAAGDALFAQTRGSH